MTDDPRIRRAYEIATEAQADIDLDLTRLNSQLAESIRYGGQ
jgi:hypothetical protein